MSAIETLGAKYECFSRIVSWEILHPICIKILSSNTTFLSIKHPGKMTHPLPIFTSGAI